MHGGAMSSAEQRDGISIRGIIRMRAWSLSALREEIPDWDERSRGDKLRILLSEPIEPFHDIVTENLVTDEYLDTLASGLNPNPTHLALGNETTAPVGTNQTLNNEVYRTRVGQDESEGKDRLTSTLISQNEANGRSIREIGLTNGAKMGEWTLLTHAILDSADQIDEKTSSMTITIDYVLEYRRA